MLLLRLLLLLLLRLLLLLLLLLLRLLLLLLRLLERQRKPFQLPLYVSRKLRERSSFPGRLLYDLVQGPGRHI